MGTHVIELSLRRKVRTAAAGAAVLAAAGLFVAVGRVPAIAADASPAPAPAPATTTRVGPSAVPLTVETGKTRILNTRSELCLTAGHSGQDVVGDKCTPIRRANTWILDSSGQLKAKDRCLTTAGGRTANGTHVVTLPCDQAATRYWKVNRGQIINQASGRCLDLTDFGTAPGTVVQLWDCTGGAHQLWGTNGHY